MRLTWDTTALLTSVTISTLLTPAFAFWRMPCPGRLVLERADPVISPGVVSGHVHTVSGGSGFSFTTSYEKLRASKCSSCSIQQDLSAYWTPKLYWMSRDGKQFIDVPQSGEGASVTGGMTVYYEQRATYPGAKLRAFPPGLRMVAGNPFQRNFTGAIGAPGLAVQFVCLDYNGVSTQNYSMPNKNCPDGLRAQVYLPSCWNGRDNDTADHFSHMAYPIQHYDNGVCPDSHPVPLISIFYEVIYQTNLFADKWWSTTQHPFVFASGDRTGYGFHGDFVNGWDTTALQEAVDTCTNLSGTLEDCPVFANSLFTSQQSQACRIPPTVNEQVTGTLSKLPGCNPPSSGPQLAVPQTCAVTPIGKAVPDYTDVTKSLKWKYVGCANDSVSDRTFRGATYFSNSMNITTCISFCKGKGYSLAGLQYASQCYCDNSYSQANRAPQPGILGNCMQPCAGAPSQICGGSNALSVYQNCTGLKSCSNYVFKA